MSLYTHWCNASHNKLFDIFNVITTCLPATHMRVKQKLQTPLSRNFWLCVCINREFDLYRNSMVIVAKLNDSGHVQLYTY